MTDKNTAALALIDEIVRALFPHGKAINHLERQAAAAIIAKHLPAPVSDGLVQRLQSLRKDMELRFTGQFCENVVNTLDAAATHIAQLEARIEKLTRALRPFAAVADEYDDREDDAFEVWKDAGPVRSIRSTFKLSMYRDARAALNEKD